MFTDSWHTLLQCSCSTSLYYQTQFVYCVCMCVCPSHTIRNRADQARSTKPVCTEVVDLGSARIALFLRPKGQRSMAHRAIGAKNQNRFSVQNKPYSCDSASRMSTVSCQSVLWTWRRRPFFAGRRRYRNRIISRFAAAAKRLEIRAVFYPDTLGLGGK